jgi:hypothetical protein
MMAIRLITLRPSCGIAELA